MKIKIYVDLPCPCPPAMMESSKVVVWSLFTFIFSFNPHCQHGLQSRMGQRKGFLVRYQLPALAWHRCRRTAARRGIFRRQQTAQIQCRSQPISRGAAHCLITVQGYQAYDTNAAPDDHGNYQNAAGGAFTKKPRMQPSEPSPHVIFLGLDTDFTEADVRVNSPWPLSAHSICSSKHTCRPTAAA